MEAKVTSGDTTCPVKKAGTSESIDQNHFVNDINREHTEVLQIQNDKSEAIETLIYGATGKQKLLYNQSDIAYNLVKDAKQSIYGFTAGNENASSLTKEIHTADTNRENDNHHVALKQDYSAYGQAKRSMLEETPQFNGEMLSSGNLTYMRARSYDSTLGQFTSKDTWLGRQTNPLSQNRNTFVENNPVNAIDPSGNWPDWGGMWNNVTNGVKNTWNSAVETTKAVVNTAVNVVKETAKVVVQTVQNVVSTVTNVVSNAWNTATRLAGNAWNTATRLAGNAWNTVKQGVRNAWNTTKQVASSAKTYVQQKAEQAKQYAAYVKREAVRKYEQTKQAVSQAVNKAKDMGIQLVFKAGMTLQQQLDYTKKIIQICSDKVSAAAEGAKKLGDMAQKSFESAKSWAGEKVAQAGDWWNDNWKTVVAVGLTAVAVVAVGAAVVLTAGAVGPIVAAAGSALLSGGGAAGALGAGIGAIGLTGGSSAVVGTLTLAGGLATAGTIAATTSSEFTDNSIHKTINNAVAGVGTFTGLVAGGASTVIGNMNVAAEKPNQNIPDTTKVNNSNDVKLKYKEGWTAEQREAADAKVKALSEGTTVKTTVNRTGTSARNTYKKMYGENSVRPDEDIDHVIDLQLGGSDTIDNLSPLDRSVNRSLGAQIRNSIKNYPDGTSFNNFKIE